MRERGWRPYWGAILVLMTLCFMISAAGAETNSVHPRAPRNGFPMKVPAGGEGLQPREEALEVTYSVSDSPATGREVTITARASGGDGNYTYTLSLWTYDRLHASSAMLCAMHHMQDSDRAAQNSWKLKLYEPGTYFVNIRAWDGSGKTGEVPLSYANTFPVSGTNLVDEKVQSLAESFCSRYSTDYERALAAHDYLINSATYDYTYARHMAQGVLLEGTGVCESYARAYYLILKQMGIDAMFVTGDSTAGSHAWNLQRIDGEWCGVDCTWDDPGTGGSEYHLYFGLDDTAMGYEHTAKTCFPTASAPVCETLRHHYYVRHGEAARWVASLAEKINQQLRLGMPEFELRVWDSDATLENGRYSTTGIPWYVASFVLTDNMWEGNETNYQLRAGFTPSSRIITVEMLREVDGDLKEAEIQIIGEYTYAAVEIIPTYTVTLNGTELAEGIDYQAVFAENRNAGTASMTISGVEDSANGHSYMGQTSAEFTILPILMEEAEVQMGPTRLIETGRAKMPIVMVTSEDFVLPAEDYTLTYQNNIEAGEAKVLVVGNGNLRGEKVLKFEILPAGKARGVMSAQLTVLESEALVGTAFLEVELPDTAVKVAAGAFAGSRVMQILIPNPGSRIAPEALEDLSGITIIAPWDLKIGSLPVADFCVVHGFYFEEMD